MRRRSFVATAAGLGTALLAGCSGDGGGGGGSGGTDGGGGGGGGSGSFSLLVSDQPAAIGDFESLDVTLDTARVFRADEDETITEGAVTGTETPGETDTASPTPSPDGTPAEDDEGFVEFALDGTTVDLTTVVGDRALSVLEGELAAGRYSGIELSVTSAEGVVDGGTVEVMVPSNRLRLVKPFEVAADSELSFVFDINVIQRGPRNGYNLLPVIGESGVAGRDVEVEEVEGGKDGETTTEPDATETATDDGSASGRQDGAGGS